jgi:hypothetical protein
MKSSKPIGAAINENEDEIEDMSSDFNKARVVLPQS